MQRYIFSPTPPSISQILSYILPLMINFILPQIAQIHRFMFYPENGEIEYQKWL